MLAITLPKLFAQIKADFDKLRSTFSEFGIHSTICIDSIHTSYVKNVKNAIYEKAEFINRCAELEEKFPYVTFDYDVKKTFTYYNNSKKENETIEAPLIWRTSLPAKPVTTSERRFRGVELSARTPIPVPEAISAMEKHKHLFDGLELWWVPKDILVEKLPDPDPILVGRIGPYHSSDNVKQYQEKYEVAYFELHRWIDETVEDGWWSKEGY